MDNSAVLIQMKTSLSITKGLWHDLDRWQFKRGRYSINLTLELLEIYTHQKLLPGETFSVHYCLLFTIVSQLLYLKLIIEPFN